MIRALPGFRSRMNAGIARFGTLNGRCARTGSTKCANTQANAAWIEAENHQGGMS